jgi:hypothetical protein
MKRTIVLTLAILVGLSLPPTVFATDADEMAEMQRHLNRQVMGKPFSVEDAAKIDAYVADAMKKGLKPVEQAPSYWQPGFTCNDLWGRSYYDYRNCAYYRHYYGRYW